MRAINSVQKRFQLTYQFLINLAGALRTTEVICVRYFLGLKSSMNNEDRYQYCKGFPSHFKVISF